jgi:uncharacterized protein (TIGR03435 family)
MLKLILSCSFIVVIPFLSQTSLAQKPSFEVASVKPNTSGRPSNGSPIRTAGGRFFTTGATLKMMLQFAYRTPDGRALRGIDIIAAPGWADTDGFDIQATAQGETEQISEDQMRLMAQSLLADRFGLKAHWEPRQTDVYNLIVAKGGPKLKMSENHSDPPRTIAMPSPSGIKVTFSDSAKSIAALADWLQPYVSRPVIDKTGLQGLFAVRLQFLLETSSVGPGAGPQAPALPPDPAGPSIFTAVEEQLGLKLESAKASVEVLVIDSVQRPSEN